MTAQEALEYGLIDGIMDKKENKKERKDLWQKMIPQKV